MKCPACHHENPPEALFCMECGKKLERRCPHCNAEYPEEARFCMQCGEKLEEDAAPLDASPEETVPEAERRQLTVMFCDLVDSTPLSEQLDPEDLREVVRAYQDTCVKVINRFEGHVAKYLGDGILVYFGYPRAHEDDARRAARAGLGIVEAITRLNTRLQEQWKVEIAVRVGIHTGLVVAGEMGAGTTREDLAIVGETPNIASRLTPLVGRRQEMGLLVERWEQVEEGMGQVVLLKGEAGIGKSRLVQVLKERVAEKPQAWLTPCQCSAYHQNSAFYPVIDVLERVVLQFEREDEPLEKLGKLEGFLVQYGFSLPEVVPLFAHLLSVPLDDRYPPLNLSPEQQKQQLLRTLVKVLLTISGRQPLLLVVEDLHWADPTTLEFLDMLVNQIPTTRILALCTFRPDFDPPWGGRTYLTTLTLHRLNQEQVVDMVQHVTKGKTFPPEVIDQIATRTDGVPLFVEELTKMVLGSGLLREEEDRYELTGGGIAPGAGCLIYLSNVLWMLGYPDRALRKSQEALNLAQKLSHPYTLAAALTHSSLQYYFRREEQAAQERAEEAIALSTEYEFQYWLVMGTIYKDWALADRADPEEGIIQMRQDLDFNQQQEKIGFPMALSLLVEMYGKVGQAEEGLTLLTEALATGHKTGEGLWEPELHRLKGELLLMQDEDEAGSEASYRQAIDIARRQQAKSLELRAVTSLGHLWQRQGKKEEARQALQEIYGWFTEGFDTVDSKEAKDLLDELS